jgi:hypothetical protein
VPCVDPDSDRRYIAGLNAKIQELTRLLCAACDALEMVEGSGINCGADLRTWWHAHQAQDKARLAKEQAQAQQQALYEAALGKLTPEERRILGL